MKLLGRRSDSPQQSAAPQGYAQPVATPAPAPAPAPVVEPAPAPIPDSADEMPF